MLLLKLSFRYHLNFLILSPASVRHIFQIVEVEIGKMLDEMRFSMAKEYEALVSTAVVLVPRKRLGGTSVAPQTPGAGAVGGGTYSWR